METVTIIGTGLIGTSIGLALKAAGYTGGIEGWDELPGALATAAKRGALTATLPARPDTEASKPKPGIVVLAGPVHSTLDWMERLAKVAGQGNLITDVGSTKMDIARSAERLFGNADDARFLPGHPMAGKERGGAELAEAELFRDAMWLFTPVGVERSPLETEWRHWVGRFGARTMDLDAARHDELCAWVSHLPQMLSTALAALLEERFGGMPDVAEELMQVGGRALRETTRLGASPYSMWRDVAMTNTENIGKTLLALEQELAYVRENLRTPELREEFQRANRFRSRRN